VDGGRLAESLLVSESAVLKRRAIREREREREMEREGDAVGGSN